MRKVRNLKECSLVLGQVTGKKILVVQGYAVTLELKATCESSLIPVGTTYSTFGTNSKVPVGCSSEGL